MLNCVYTVYAQLPSPKCEIRTKPYIVRACKQKGRKRRIGFGKKGKNSFTVHRSEEVLPGEMRVGALSRGSSASSDGDASIDVDRFDNS